MKIILNKIWGEGFLSFFDPFKFDLVPFNGKSIQIDGRNEDEPLAISNGAGKSNLLEAIVWGFFGELCRKNQYKEEAIHKDLDDCYITLDFTINDQHYCIKRTLERKASPSLTIDKFLKEDEWEPLIKNSTYTTKQSYIEQLLGMDKTSFLCCTMFGTNFMNFPDMPPANRAKVLSDIRGLERFEKASKRSSDKKTSLDKETISKNADLQKDEGRLEELRLSDLSKDIERFEKDKKLQIEQLETDKSETLEQKKEVKIKKQEEQERLHDIIFAKEDELGKFPHFDIEEETISLRLKEIISSLMGFRKEEGSISSSIEMFLSHVWDLERIEGICPICKQIISPERKEKELKKLQKSIKDEEKNLVETKDQIKKLGEEQYIEERKSSDLKIKIRQYQEKEKELRSLQLMVGNLDLKYDTKIFDQQLTSIDKDILSIETKENPYVKLEKERRSKIRELGKITRDKKKEIEFLEKEQSLYDFWITGFRKIRLMLFDSLLDSLNDEISNLLSKYSSNLLVNFSSQRETKSGTIKDEINIEITDSEGKKLSYEMYSGGEKQKIRLAISMTLAKIIQDKCGREFNFIAFDEPNDALDDVGKEINFNLFQQLSEEGKLVLVTDHDASFKERFDNNILIVKKDDKSCIQ